MVTLGACGGSAPVSEDRQAVAVPVSDAPQRLNGCDRLTATEQPGASVRLPFGGMFGFAFDPACIALAVGTELTFVGNFAQHPLKPGRGRPVILRVSSSRVKQRQSGAWE